MASAAHFLMAYPSAPSGSVSATTFSTGIMSAPPKRSNAFIVGILRFSSEVRSAFRMICRTVCLVEASSCPFPWAEAWTSMATTDPRDRSGPGAYRLRPLSIGARDKELPLLRARQVRPEDQYYRRECTPHGGFPNSQSSQPCRQANSCTPQSPRPRPPLAPDSLDLTAR